jgi:hypothetical protein
MLPWVPQDFLELLELDGLPFSFPSSCDLPSERPHGLGIRKVQERWRQILERWRDEGLSL